MSRHLSGCFKSVYRGEILSGHTGRLIEDNHDIDAPGEKELLVPAERGTAQRDYQQSDPHPEEKGEKEEYGLQPELSGVESVAFPNPEGERENGAPPFSEMAQINSRRQKKKQNKILRCFKG